MIVQAFTIARNTFVESVRQPVLFILVLASGLLQVFNTLNTAYSMADTESSQVQGDTKLLFDIGLATVFGLATLLAGFLATAVISREIENKTVLTIVSKPISRPVLVIGKFLGVTGAILVATLIMLIFLMLGVRHGVMTTAADDVDGPVVLFGVGGVVLSLLIAGWCNYFYGWSFPQTVVLSLAPIMVLAYALVLVISKQWRWQSPGVDFKDQVLLACLCLTMAVVVLTSIATAASTRFGQVTTIVLCLAIFVGALLTNYFIGRHVFKNQALAVIDSATPGAPERPTLAGRGDYFTVRLKQAPKEAIKPGEPFYFGPTPDGFPLMTREPIEAYSGDLSNTEAMLRAPVRPGLIVTRSEGLELTIRNIGATPYPIARPPEADDYVFTSPTRVNYAAMVVWGVVPNMQFFWLLDAVSQNRLIPGEYIGLVAGYTVAQVGMFLSLAVILFQRRDVG